MAYERKDFGFEVKELDDAGRVEGYASVFGGVDSYGDTVMPGAFAKSIAARKPKMLADHDMRARAGVWDEVREDERGLYVKGRLNMEKQMVRELYSDMKMGALDGLSIGYRTLQDEMQGKVRKLKEIDLMEVSFVTIGADPNAKVTAVKSLDMDTMQDMSREEIEEAFMRGAKPSRTVARKFAAWAYDEVAKRGAGGPDESKAKELLTLLQNFGR